MNLILVLFGQHRHNSVLHQSQPKVSADAKANELVVCKQTLRTCRVLHEYNNLICWNQLLARLLQTLGSLADKFPTLASLIVTILREFLVLPSPILDRLSRHSDGLNKQKARHSFVLKTQQQDMVASPTLHKPSVVNKITDAFIQLRNEAMRNVCVWVLTLMWQEDEIKLRLYSY